MSATTVSTVNPADGQVISQYKIMDRQTITNTVKQSRTAFEEWKKLDISKRAEFMQNFAQELRKNKEALARTATQEMGKPVKESLSEVEKCAWVMEYYGDNGPVFLNDEVVNTDARKSIITFQPLGVIGSIMPWNFPYWQALRFAAPSLIVGNTIVLKPASATMQCGIEIENSFKNIGLPDGVFKTLIGDSSIAETLIDSDINAVTFTGSVPVGAKVASRATSQWKKCVLELGGSDPFIVCKDADIEKAAAGAVKGRFINCGQSCIASKRFLVVQDVAQEFIEKFVQKVEKLVVGDPMQDNTDIGPLVNQAALKNIDALVKDAVSNGAEVLTGGGPVENNGGYFYKPTVLAKISPNMRVASEEVFGPVAPVSIVEDEMEALKIANDSEYGLGASIWTEDLDRAEELSRAVESGIVTINNVVASDPRVPFGGIKHSGFGRELSRYGMLEFVNIKSIRFYDQLTHHHHVE
jgi:succinate-semialdehyde dehydrogenase/glutarate-semialdehyde dehydrogenase/succinyl-CoA reductase